MTKKIHKLPLALVDGPQRYLIPILSEVLHVDEQKGRPTLWYLFLEEDESRLEERTFQIHPTGRPIPLKDRYLGSCQVPDFVRPLVWHVFEVSRRIDNK